MENKNKDEEFVISFDDDAVDMTDVNRLKKNDTYGTYQPSGTTNTNTGYGSNSAYGSNSTYNSGNTYSANNEYDPYGVYRPDLAAQQAKKNSRERERKLEQSMTKLIYMVMIIEVLYLAFFSIPGNDNFAIFTILSYGLNLLLELVFIVDGCIMYKNYKKVSLIVTATIFPIFYPMVRNSARGERKSMSAMWLLLVIVLAFTMAKNNGLSIALNAKKTTSGTEVYSSKYNAAMKKFKNYKYDGNSKTIDVINVYFETFKLDVTSEQDGYLNVKVSGKTSISIVNVVEADSKKDPNTVMLFNVNKEDGSFIVTGLQINGGDYSGYAADLWEYWCMKFSK